MEGGRYNFSMGSKQIKHSNDHIKGNQVRKGGRGGATWYPPLGETLCEVFEEACASFAIDQLHVQHHPGDPATEPALASSSRCSYSYILDNLNGTGFSLG